MSIAAKLMIAGSPRFSSRAAGLPISTAPDNPTVQVMVAVSIAVLFRSPFPLSRPAARLAVALLSLGLPAGIAAQDAQTGLQQGDMVRLKIWREPELSGDFQVNERGETVFPKIGPMLVTRLSADSLSRLLVATYTAYLRDPSIEVTLLRRVNVLGAVRSPGLYQVDQTQTLGDVLAQAGGATSEGKADRVELRRGGERLGIRLNRSSRLFDSSVQSGDQLWVPERSWFSRNSGTVVAAGLTATAIVVATLLR
jgi:polysaccharide export outer membrane protein